jgi:hypothetical protein
MVEHPNSHNGRFGHCGFGGRNGRFRRLLAMAAIAWRTITFGLLTPLAAALLAGCATPAHQNLERISLGMDKTQVLDAAGNPKRTARKDSGDLWTYVYYVGDKHFERDVRFEQGHVVSVTSAREVNPDAQKVDAVTQDYENLVNEAKAKKNSP